MFVRKIFISKVASNYTFKTDVETFSSEMQYGRSMKYFKLQILLIYKFMDKFLWSVKVIKSRHMLALHHFLN